MRDLLTFGLLIAAAVSISCSGGLVEVPLAAVPSASAADPEVDAAQKFIDKAPDSAMGYNNLAVIYIKRARATGDFELNRSAEAAVERALEREPANPSSRKLQASLALTFHRFSEGLELGKRLQQEMPEDPFVYGVLTDANAELGNYAEAVAAAQKMVDLRPNSASYARVAHLRSLHGDHAGAVEMYKVAARTADPVDREAQSWCLVQLGKELWNNGKYKEAGKVFDEALGLIPDYRLAIIAKARNLAAMEDLDAAERLLLSFDGSETDPDANVLLSQIYARQGDQQRSQQFFNRGNDLESKNIGTASEQQHVANLWADNDLNLPQALQIAEEEYTRQKDIYTADTLAWCLFKLGRFKEAKRYSDEAVRLKTNDSRLIYHAGMIENAMGNQKAGRRLLQKALELNRGFDLKQANLAKQVLAKKIK